VIIENHGWNSFLSLLRLGGNKVIAMAFRINVIITV